MKPGDLVSDRYRVVEQLGEGGMGAVYRVTDLELSEDVALKVLSPRLVRDGWLERFRAEVRLARKVTHKNVARIYDIGAAGDDVRYLTMELVDGESLRRHMRRLPGPGVAEACAIGAALASGLAAAHEAGVVHGDIKPGNAMIERGGRVVLVDFGLAKSVDDGKALTDIVVGTPSYMAPEQLRGERAHRRSDVYALGLILFEMIAHERPFAGEDGVARARSRLARPAAPDLRAFRAVPATLADLVAACLAPAPEDRPDAAAVAAALASMPVSEAAGDFDELFVDEPTAIVPPPGARASRLAVLPFAAAGKPHGDTARASALADGLTDALRELLSLTNGLRVLPTDAARGLPGGLTPRAAGLELGVEAVVAGEVRIGPSAVHIDFRLVDVETGTVEVEERLTGGVGDLLRLQDGAARRIAEQLRVRLSTDAYKAIVPADAVETWLRVRALVRPGPGFDAATAYDELGRCLEKAPGFLLAHADRAVAAARLAIAPHREGPWLERARAATAAALAVAGDVPDTHYAAALLAELDGSYGEAVAAIEHALRLAPAFAQGHELLGRLELESGRVKDGARRLFLAAALDHRCASSLALVVRAALFRGFHDDAARLSSRLEHHHDRSFELLLLRARAAGWRGERADDVRAALPLFAGSPVAELVGGVVASADGDVGPLLAYLARLEQRAPHARFLALIHQLAAEAVAARDRGAALDHIEAADWHHLLDLDWLDHCPPLRPLAADPRFVRVRERVARRVLRV